MLGLRDLRARLTGAGVELKVAVVAGADANTDIPLAGIKPGDALIAVLELQPPTAAAGNAVVADHAGETTIKKGAISLSVATTGNQLLVLWWSV